MTTPVEILAARIGARVEANGPAIRELAEQQIADLRVNGYAIVPSFELSAVWAFLGSVLDKAAKGIPLSLVQTNRGEGLRQKVRALIPDERYEDD